MGTYNYEQVHDIDILLITQVESSDKHLVLHKQKPNMIGIATALTHRNLD